MKKLLLLSLGAILTICSCINKTNKPVDPAVKNSFTATVDGVPETFNFKDSIRTIGTRGIYITGANETTSDKIMLFLSGNSLGTGTYSSAAGGLQMFYGAGPGYTFDNYYFTYDSSSVATVKLTSIDSTGVKGTFSGSVVLEASVISSGSRPIKTITDGKFDLTLKATTTR